MKLVPGSADAQRWSSELQLPFYEASIETNGHNVSLVFSDLTVHAVQPGSCTFRRAGGRTGFQDPVAVGGAARRRSKVRLCRWSDVALIRYGSRMIGQGRSHGSGSYRVDARD